MSIGVHAISGSKLAHGGQSRHETGVSGLRSTRAQSPAGEPLPRGDSWFLRTPRTQHGATRAATDDDARLLHVRSGFDPWVRQARPFRTWPPDIRLDELPLAQAHGEGSQPPRRSTAAGGMLISWAHRHFDLAPYVAEVLVVDGQVAACDDPVEVLDRDL